MRLFQRAGGFRQPRRTLPTVRWSCGPD